MKNLLWLTILILSPLFSFAQQAESKKGDTVIILKTTDSFKDAYKKVGQLMILNGYFIDFESNDIGVITTEKVRVKGSQDPDWFYRVNAIVTGDETATITITAMLSNSSNDWDRVEKRGLIYGIVWDKVETLAKQYNGAAVEFK